jgi:hypothetical protein
MNFLSHDVILPEGAPPLMRVASALPDLWSRLPSRPIPYRFLPALRAAGSAEAQAVADGIESHLRADEVFHRHPEFLARMDRVEDELTAVWPGLQHSDPAAHILVEMMLDRWLMLADGARVASYYACFTAEHIAAAARLGTTTDASRDVLAGVLTFFNETRFLADYVDPRGLAHRFCRAWGRTSFGAREPPPEEAIAAWVERSHDALAPRSEELIEAGRAAVAGLGAERAAVTPPAPP